MKRSSTIFLQFVVVLIGLAALAFLIYEPLIEGRNAHATLYQVYFNDAFLAYVYFASIPFFFGLYQAFKILAFVRHDAVFSPENVKALRTIKFCALATLGFAIVSLFFMVSADDDDRPAGLFLRILVSFPSIVVAAAAAMFERILQNAVDLKAENDLTV